MWWSLSWIAAGIALGLLYQHRKRLRRAYRSWRASRRECQICPGCDNEIMMDWCWCGASPDSHSAFSGHSPVPAGCRCHEDRGEEISA